jgi:hypothetical protein
MKELYAIVATLLIAIAYWPYVRDVRRNKTWPHPYSWFVSGFLTFIVFGLQITGGGGWGTLPTFAGACAGILVFLLGLAHKQPRITTSDKAFLALAILALLLWLFAKEAVASIVLLTLIDVFSFIPTIRKSWDHPEQETVAFYFLSSARFTFAIVALTQFTIVTMLYPAVTLIIDAATGVYLILRRNHLANK